MPGLPPLPGFMQVVYAAAAGQNTVIQQTDTLVISDISPGEIAAAHESSSVLPDDSLADLAGRSVGATRAPMAMDEDDDSDDISEASEIADEVSLKKVMGGINTMEKRQIHANKKIRASTRVMVAEAVNPVWDQLRSAQGNISELRQGQGQHNARIGKLETTVQGLEDLESRFEELQVGGPRDDKNDPAHLRVASKGFSTESLEERIETLKTFAGKHLGNRTYVCIDMKRVINPSSCLWRVFRAVRFAGCSRPSSREAQGPHVQELQACRSERL